MRVPLVRDGDDPAFDRAMAATSFGKAGIPVISRVLGHHQQLTSCMQAYNDVLRREPPLLDYQTEILILATCRRAGNRYGFGRHIPLGRKAGLSEVQIRAIGSAELAPNLFAEPDLLLLEIAYEATHTLSISDETYSEFVRHFDATDLPVVLQLVGFYVLLTIVQRGVMVELEPEFVSDLDDCWPPTPA